MSKSQGEIDWIKGMFLRSPWVLVLLAQEEAFRGSSRVIKGHRGSLYKAQEEAIGYGWLCVKRDFTEKPSFSEIRAISPRNFTLWGFERDFTGKPSFQGSILARVILCIGSPIGGCLRDFLSLSLYDAQEKAKLNEEFF